MLNPTGVTLAPRSAHAVLVGPTAGGSASPAFRALVAADLPTELTGSAWRTDGLSVTPAALPDDGSSAFMVSTVMPAVTSGTRQAVYVSVTGAGSSGNTQIALRAALEAGYTGGTYTYAGHFTNVGAGGVPVGLYGASRGTGGAGVTNCGVFGLAAGAAGNVGGYFSTSTALGPDSFGASCALIASNGTTSTDILRLYDNTALVARVADGGDWTLTGAVAALSFTGSGSGLTALNASNLSSGTVPTARLGSGTADNTTFLRGDNTWASPPPGGGGSGDMLADFVNAAVSHTNPAAATLTANAWNVVAATSGSPSVKLPAPAAGKVVGLRVTGGSTALLTLNPNGSENIGPGTNASRVLHHGESAVLVSDGTDWVKVAGLSIPMKATIYNNATQNVLTGTTPKIGVNASWLDNTGAMVDAANGKILIKRSSDYRAVGKIGWTAGPPGALQSRVHKNGSLLINIASIDWSAICDDTVALAAGDYLELYSFNATGSTVTSYGAAGDPTTRLAVTELPAW